MCSDVCTAFKKDKCIGEVLKSCSILQGSATSKTGHDWPVTASGTEFFFNFKEFLPISTLSQISTDCSSLISRLCSVCLLPVACVLPLCESGFLLYCLATSHVHRPNLHCQSMFHSMSVFSPPFAKVDTALG